MRIYRNKNSNLHREGAPAIQEKHGLCQWYLEGKLHNAAGPAVTTSLGTSRFFWKGIYIPTKLWSKAKNDMKLPEILDVKNLELRRCLIEIVGMEKLSREAIVVDTNSQSGAVLYRFEIPEDEACFFIRVLDGTIRNGRRQEYFIRVPPTMQTALEAVAWTFKRTPATYHPAIET